MDVRALLLAALVFLLAACDNNSEEGKNTLFNKPDYSNCESMRIAEQYLVRWKDGSITVENGKDDDSFIDDFIAANGDKIHMAEPHFRVFGFSAMNIQLAGFGGDENWGVGKIKAPLAWERGFKGQGIVVAVIDSGFDDSHPELQDVMAVNEAEEINGEDDDGNGYVDDRYGYDFVGRSHVMVDRTGHGSHVSGIIAARHDVGRVMGAAPEAKILPLNFIDETQNGSINDAIASIRYAAARNAKIINASWGGPYCSQALKQELEDLEKQGILFISAAGNSGRDLELQPEYPAAFNLANHIAVGASTFSDKTAGFSNYGKPVALVAPGAHIVSTVPKIFDIPTCSKSDDDQVVCEPDGLAALDGTSMAAPFVSAAAAVLWSAKPDADFRQIKEALLKGVNLGPFPVETRGRIDLDSALDYLLETGAQNAEKELR